jgi:hypothetical protein
MNDYDEDNDGRYPGESPVEIRYPRSKQEEQAQRVPVLTSRRAEVTAAQPRYLAGHLNVPASLQPSQTTAIGCFCSSKDVSANAFIVHRANDNDTR